MPTGGPVTSYTVTQGPGAQSQRYQQFYPQPPGVGDKPQEIVDGFLTASASLANGQQIAREYLTPQASRRWNPNWSATVYSNGPSVTQTVFPAKNQAQVTVTGNVQAILTGYGSYAITQAKEQGVTPTFSLVKNNNGQWRISYAPPELLLTSELFKDDYQLRNLYFFDPTGKFLVPDPVYVPLEATPSDLMNGLVHDLITPLHDWLSRGATKTAFPPGTVQLGDVTLDGGTATVNLGGAITKSPNPTVMQQVSSQLWWTLTSSAQAPAVQTVQVNLNNKPWIPANSGGNPVQHQAAYNPPTGAGSIFYYLDATGNLWSRDGASAQPVKVSHIGTGYSQIAVSPNRRFVAALSDGSLFIGPMGGKLSRRDGAGYTTMSWDPGSNLWATTGDQVVMLRGAANPAQPLGQPVDVTMYYSDGTTPVDGPFTSLRVAPDGVRVALIIGDATLYFGAIASQQGVRPGQTNIKIVFLPFSAAAPGTGTFSAVTWYGPDNVITLGGPGSVLTEYPVDGGSATSITAESRMQSISASWKSALLAGLPKGGMSADASLGGSWLSFGAGISPVYPG